MSSINAQADQRLVIAVTAMMAGGAFAEKLAEEVEAFFARHAEITRTHASNAIATGFIFEFFTRPELNAGEKYPAALGERMAQQEEKGGGE